MAGSGHLQTLRLLKFLRSRNFADGHSNFGCQMAVSFHELKIYYILQVTIIITILTYRISIDIFQVSLGIGFLFLGGGMRTFSRSNSAISILLITLYPRLPTGPNDNRCHLQVKIINNDVYKEVPCF